MLLLFWFVRQVSLVISRKPDQKKTTVADVGHIEGLPVLNCDHCCCTSHRCDSSISLLDDVDRVEFTNWTAWFPCSVSSRVLSILKAQIVEWVQEFLWGHVKKIMRRCWGIQGDGFIIRPIARTNRFIITVVWICVLNNFQGLRVF